MRKEYLEKIDIIAKQHGYLDYYDMMMDYGYVPTVRVPKHKKHELVILLIKNGIKNKKI